MALHQPRLPVWVATTRVIRPLLLEAWLVVEAVQLVVEAWLVVEAVQLVRALVQALVQALLWTQARVHHFTRTCPWVLSV